MTRFLKHHPGQHVGVMHSVHYGNFTGVIDEANVEDEVWIHLGHPAPSLTRPRPDAPQRSLVLVQEQLGEPGPVDREG